MTFVLEDSRGTIWIGTVAGLCRLENETIVSIPTHESGPSNKDGVWNEEGALIDINVRSMFYETYWFYSVCALTLAPLVRTGFRTRVRYLSRRESELVCLIEERTQQLRQASQMLESRTIELEAANRTLHGLSYVDPLTGVANRRRFEEVLDAELKRARRAAGQISLIMIDIDFFKAFNDEYGHQAGDDCLRRVAGVLTTACRRAGDLVARYGGEEFVIVLPDTDVEAAVTLAGLLREDVANLAIPHETSAVADVLTISLGVTSALGESAPPASEVVSVADKALYQAKRAGRNQTAVLH